MAFSDKNETKTNALQAMRLLMRNCTISAKDINQQF
jgi:hypothetical protein